MVTRKELIHAAQEMKQAGEEEDWDRYYEIKDEFDLGDGEGFWELMKRASNAPD
jgi:hypothetical protein